MLAKRRGGAGGGGDLDLYFWYSGLWWYSASADWDLYSAALPDYKLFSRINTFESILSRSAAEIMGNWHTGNLSNSELKTNIFVSDGDSPTEHSSKTQDCQNKYKPIHQ